MNADGVVTIIWNIVGAIFVLLIGLAMLGFFDKRDD